mgnify:FL=1
MSSDRSGDEADQLPDAVLPLAREMVEFADLLEEKGVPPDMVVIAMAVSYDIKATEHGAQTLVSETNRDVLEK